MGKPQHTVEGRLCPGRGKGGHGESKAKWGMNKSFLTLGLAAFPVCIGPSEGQAALPARSR